MANDPGATGDTGEPREVPAEELRLAVVLNGGVSLAVWMGGASLELDRLARGEGVYGSLLALTGCRARIDVIAGTSAGGINGAALALSQANRKARLSDLRDIWTDQGQIDTLLRRPFRGSPASLLRGDEYFLPRLNEAMQRLATPFEPTDPRERPIDLTITATLLNGVQKVTVDSTGQRLPQWVHDGRFRFRRGAAESVTTSAAPVDPFSPGHIHATADQLALAARCTASFPVAFEPSFVPVDQNGPRPSAQDEQRLRPDMSSVASWSSGNRDRPGWVSQGPGERSDVSRFTVDGGLLANMPTRSALRAVDGMPASGPVRRVMLLVHPHAPGEQFDHGDDPEHAPTLAGSLGAILGALTAQGSRTFVEHIEEHNIRAAGRRGTRADVLRTVENVARLESLAAALLEQYRQLRMWRAGRDVAALTAPQEGWNAERIRGNARRAQEHWLAARKADGDGRPPLPYVPATLASGTGAGWGWGVSAAVGIADAVSDILRQLVWVLPAGEDYDRTTRAREQVSLLRRQIQGTRALTDDLWQQHPVISGLEPTQTLFSLRIAWYEWALLGAATSGSLQRLRAQITGLIAEVASHEAQREEAAADPGARAAEVRQALHEQLLGEGASHGEEASRRVVQPGAIGAIVSARVDEVVANLMAALPVLSEVGSRGPADLAAWARILGRVSDADALLRSLVALEVLTTAVGDETQTENSLPLELVQLSAQTHNGFALASQTADDKLGGMAISRFGGFLKRSWRLNDWAWGRADAATVLCRLVLDPSRLRRTALLSGRLTSGADAAQVAQEVFDELAASWFGTPDGPPIPDWDGLRADALAELAEAYSDIPVGDLPPTMPRLAELAAWAIHSRAIVAELPALSRAAQSDAVAGANPRSNSALLVVEHADLIRRLEEQYLQSGAEEPAAMTDSGLRDAVAALRAFDRAGVGRESLQEEGSSDQMLRTATSAAAVATTVVDSDQSGLGAVKPVTRTLRGGMLLPYWVVTALTSGGTLSRALALLGLSVGAVLLALALFGALPMWASGVGAAFGASALLVAFAYGALRTGSLLHSLVLLSPVIPLLVFAVERSREGGPDPSAAQGAATLLVVVGLAIGLMLLGSLPAPMLSVYGELDRAADRAGIPPVPLEVRGGRRARAQTVRRVRAVLRLVATSLGTLLGVAAIVAAVVLAASTQVWVDAADWVQDHQFVAIAAGTALALFGLGLAAWQGRSLRVAFDASEEMGQQTPVWRFLPVRHPAGVTVGWSALYGMLYLLLIAFLVWDPWSWLDQWWGEALLGTAVTFAVALLVVVPVVVPWRAKRGIERSQIDFVHEQLIHGTGVGDVDTRGLKLTARGKRLARTIGDSIDPQGAAHGEVKQANRARLLRDLVERSHGYHFLVATASSTAADWTPSEWGAEGVTVSLRTPGGES